MNPGVTLAQVAKDFGIHEKTLAKRMRRVDIEEGRNSVTMSTESAELRELRKRGLAAGGGDYLSLVSGVVSPDGPASPLGSARKD